MNKTEVDVVYIMYLTYHICHGEVHILTERITFWEASSTVFY